MTAPTYGMKIGGLAGKRVWISAGIADAYNAGDQAGELHRFDLLERFFQRQ